MCSLHGAVAARRQATTELLFFASVGDIGRIKKICDTWAINVRHSPPISHGSCLTIHCTSVAFKSHLYLCLTFYRYCYTTLTDVLSVIL